MVTGFYKKLAGHVVDQVSFVPQRFYRIICGGPPGLSGDGNKGDSHDKQSA
jgi:hypothetical protein